MRKAFAFASVARLLCLAVAFTLLTIATLTTTGCGSGSIAPCTTCGSKTTPTITWPTPAAIIYGTALSSIQLDATASVAGTFTYTPASGTVLGAGTQTLYVSFAPTDTADYTSASASVQLTVTQAASIIGCPAPAAIIYGTALGSTQLDCKASVAGSIVYTLAGNVPAMGAIPPQGTDTIYVTFTPTDATDYTSVTATMSIVVNPAVPTITGITPRYVVADTFSFFVNYAITGTDFVNGDTIRDVSGLFPDITLPPGSGATSFGVTYQWESGYYEPWFVNLEMQHPGGAYGAQWATAFMGSGSQSTAVVSSTGMIFQDAENKGIYALKMDGTQSLLPISGIAAIPTGIAVDDTTANIVLMGTDVVYSSSDILPAVINVFKEDGTPVCSLNLGAVPISSVAAKGGYFVVTDPGDNKIGVAGMDCTGYHTIPIPGQPWAVAMTNGSELEAYVLSRDKASVDGLPMLSKVNVLTGVIEGTVKLTGFTPVSTVRAANSYQGLYQLAVSTATQTAAVLSASDNLVLIVNTTVSSGEMQIAHTIPVPEIPFGITAQDSTFSTTFWVAYILENSGEATTHIGAIDPATGNYASGIGTCQAGILAGGFVANSNGVYCAMGSVIEPPLALQP